MAPGRGFSWVAAYEFRQVEPLGCFSYLLWLVGYQLCVTLLYFGKLENGWAVQ